MPKLPSMVSAPTARARYSPCRRAARAASRSPEPRACETRMEMAIENPRPTINGTYKILLAKVAAANGNTPSRPTMSVSAREIKIWLIWPAASGSARAAVRRPSRPRRSRVLPVVEDCMAGVKVVDARNNYSQSESNLSLA